MVHYLMTIVQLSLVYFIQKLYLAKTTICVEQLATFHFRSFNNLKKSSFGEKFYLNLAPSVADYHGQPNISTAYCEKIQQVRPNWRSN